MEVHPTRLVAALPLAFLLAGCASTQPDPIGERGPDLGNYTVEEIEAAARRLLTARGLSERKCEILLGKLDRMLASKPAWLEQPGVTGVAVYHTAGGGFIYAAGGGDGAVSFKGGDREVPFEVTGYKVGGVIGGGGHDGIGLVLDLRDQRLFFGHYATKEASALGGDSQAGSTVAEYSGGGHQIRAFATGYGAEASAAVGRFTVAPPKQP